jgi:hypothetical protein
MDSAQMKENMITEYIKNIDFRSQQFSIQDIKSDIKSIIHEFPAVEVSYTKDRQITEDKNTGEKKTIIEENVKSITIAFSDGEYEMDYGDGRIVTMPKMHKFTLYI